MIEYGWKQTFNLWDYDLVHQTHADGRITVVKDNFRPKQEVMDWINEKKYVCVLSFDPAAFRFDDNDAAFDFKMRWL